MASTDNQVPGSVEPSNFREFEPEARLATPAVGPAGSAIDYPPEPERLVNEEVVPV
jgi:hypothetical protein